MNILSYFQHIWRPQHPTSYPMATKQVNTVIRVDLSKLRALVRNKHLGSTVLVWDEIDENDKEKSYKQDEYDITLEQHNELVVRLKSYLEKVQASADTPKPLRTDCLVFIDDPVS